MYLKKRRDAAKRVYPVPFGAVAMDVKYWNLVEKLVARRFIFAAVVLTLVVSAL